jgi:phosphotransferase system  glucose/maltose/N-acetylglucosamine-specific IIC component
MALSTQSIIQMPSLIQASTVQAVTPTQSNWVWTAAIVIIAILALVSYLVTRRKQHESTGSKKK